ncbi:MAG: PrpF family protein [Burkholderiales bacterium]|nr:PrpF family protein [Burkholderiales bacterium]
MRTGYKAVFARGGTSKALIFHQADLPAERSRWDELFLACMGSPDPYGRQLDGMGGGVSSLSKVCIVGPATRPDADVDYTFAQVQVKDARVDYSGNCGNMSSAIGPFAVDEGLVRADGETAVVRIHNTNTGKIIHASFPVAGGQSVERGELVIPGVAGSGAPVRLDFLEPGGASTGKLLPSGRARDVLTVAGVGDVEVSLIDAANACVFVDAASLGLAGTELPDELDARTDVLAKLAAIREHASVAMGITASLDEARRKPMIPLIAFVSAPTQSRLLDGSTLPASAVDLTVRMISSGQPHRALPVTGSLCTAVAAAIEGSLPHRLAQRAQAGTLRLGMPSGVICVDADVLHRPEGWYAVRGSFYRTTRRLFDGTVYG